MEICDCDSICPICKLKCNGIGLNSHNCNNKHKWSDEEEEAQNVGCNLANANLNRSSKTCPN